MSRYIHVLRHLPPHASETHRLYGRGVIKLDEDSADVLASLQTLADYLPVNGQWIATSVPRTHTTAQKILTLQNRAPHEFTVRDDLAEQNLGVFYEQDHDALNSSAEFHAYKNDPVHYCPKDGESFASYCQRVQASLEELATVKTDNDLIVSAHGGTIRAAYAALLGKAMREATKTHIAPLSCLTLRHENGQWHEHDFVEGVTSTPLTNPALV